MKQPTGIIVYEGPSLLDGQPIVAIANAFRGSQNHKTGKMVQVWIIRSDMHPYDAVLTRGDFSICGDCRHRAKKIEDGHAIGGSCYVNLMYGPFSVFHAYKRGTYKRFELPDMRFFKNRHIRLGAYGDPAAVPVEVWETLCGVASGWTGYTHQWRTCDQRLAAYCMASADIEAEHAEAIAKGWRVFRVRRSTDAALFEDEMVCPASDEAGKKLDCKQCSGCCGNRSNRKNVAIVVHGWEGRVRAFLRNIALEEPDFSSRAKNVVLEVV